MKAHADEHRTVTFFSGFKVNKYNCDWFCVLADPVVAVKHSFIIIRNCDFDFFRVLSPQIHAHPTLYSLIDIC